MNGTKTETNGIIQFVVSIGTILAYAAAFPAGFALFDALQSLTGDTPVAFDPLSPTGGILMMGGVGLVCTGIYLTTQYLKTRRMPHSAVYLPGIVVAFGVADLLTQNILIDRLMPSEWWLSGPTGLLMSSFVAGITGYTIHVLLRDNVGDAVEVADAE